MMLYIMRHGLAEDTATGGGDGERKLTAEGREKIRKAAAGMRTLKVELDAIATSPLVRATETAAIVAAEFGGSPAPQPMPALAAGSAPAEVLTALKHLEPCESLMIVGHEPALSRVASLLISGSAEAAGIRLKQGGVIALELPDRIERGAAQLRWMMTQRQLRSLK